MPIDHRLADVSAVERAVRSLAIRRELLSFGRVILIGLSFCVSFSLLFGMVALFWVTVVYGMVVAGVLFQLRPRLVDVSAGSPSTERYPGRSPHEVTDAYATALRRMRAKVLFEDFESGTVIAVTRMRFFDLGIRFTVHASSTPLGSEVYVESQYIDGHPFDLGGLSKKTQQVHRAAALALTDAT